FLRVVVGPGGNVPTRPPTPAFGGFGPFGAFGLPPQQQQQASVVLIPLPRLNAILVAAPGTRVKDVEQEIRRLDRPSAPAGQATPFQLKRAAAARVAAQITAFYAQRYGSETAAQNQVRITSDDNTNTVFVQAAPADLAEIRDLIWRIDNTV